MSGTHLIRFDNAICGVSLAAAMLFYQALPAKADLVGATVSIGGYYPTASDLFTNVITGTVPVSFPVGSLVSVTSLQIIPASFDVTADQMWLIPLSQAGLYVVDGSVG
jgi:hypothetical protein